MMFKFKLKLTLPYLLCLVSIFIDAHQSSYLEMALGTMPLAPENEAFILNIAREMNAPTDITIRKMNLQAIKIFGERNAFALGPLWGIPPYIFVSEGFFDSLSKEEKRFVIAHEIAHITKKHSALLLLATASFLGLNCLMWSHLTTIMQEQTKEKRITGCLFGLTASLISFLCMQYYKRNNIERIADLEALEQLHCFDGCNDFLKHIENTELEKKQYLWLLFDHPSNTQRREWCDALQKQFIYQTNHL